MTNNFEILLGDGSFGKVFHGYLDDDTEVAVKMLSQSSRQGYDQFEAEVKLLLTVHHRNLTALCCYCDEGNHVGLIYECMANGNLKDHLRAEGNEDVLSWKGRLRIAVESAQGLEFLQYFGCKAPKVHRDVKSGNIILDQRLHGNFDSNSAWKIVELAMNCESQTSIRRPAMNHVVIVLKDCLAMEMARTDSHVC